MEAQLKRIGAHLVTAHAVLMETIGSMIGPFGVIDGRRISLTNQQRMLDVFSLAQAVVDDLGHTLDELHMVPGEAEQQLRIEAAKDAVQAQVAKLLEQQAREN